MRSKIVPKICMAVICLVICFLILGLISANKKKTFIGINGQIITGYGIYNTSYLRNSNELVPNVGDIIKNEAGEEEVVFAVNEDGSYITVTPEIYREVSGE